MGFLDPFWVGCAAMKTTLIFIFRSLCWGRPERDPDPGELGLIVCHCHGVSDRNVRLAIRCGARTANDVARDCMAGSGCGGCHRTLESLIHAEASDELDSESGPAQAA